MVLIKKIYALTAGSAVVSGGIVVAVVSLKKEKIQKSEIQEKTTPLVTTKTLETSGCATTDYCVVPDHNSIGF